MFKFATTLFLGCAICLILLVASSPGADPADGCDAQCRLRTLVYTNSGGGAFYQYQVGVCEFCFGPAPIPGTPTGRCVVDTNDPAADLTKSCVIPPMGALATQRTKCKAQNSCNVPVSRQGYEFRSEAKTPVPINGEQPQAADKTTCTGPGNDPGPT